MKTKTLLQQLQSRIDLRSNDITEAENYDNVFVDIEEHIQWLRQEQTLDKRLYAKLIEQERFIYNIYSEI